MNSGSRHLVACGSQRPQDAERGWEAHGKQGPPRGWSSPADRSRSGLTVEQSALLCDPGALRSSATTPLRPLAVEKPTEPLKKIAAGVVESGRDPLTIVPVDEQASGRWCQTPSS